MTKKNRWIQLAFGIVMLSMSTQTQATGYLWDGQFGEQWGFLFPVGGGMHYSNWNPDLGLPESQLIPGSGDFVVFISSTAFPDVDINGNRTVESVIFDGGVGYSLYSDNSTHTLTLENGDITAAGVSTHGIYVNMLINTDGTWLIDEAATLIVDRLVNTGNNKLTKDGAGTLRFTEGDEYIQSSINSLIVLDGTVLIDEAHILLTSTTAGFKVKGGVLTLQNAANVETTGGINSRGEVNSGTLKVSGNDTSLTTPTLLAGKNSSDSGNIIVEAYASLNLADGALIGYRGDGYLTVSSGATVSIDPGEVVLGSENGTGVGDLIVTGDNSLLSVAEDLNLGGQNGSTIGDQGTLTVEDGGAVDIGRMIFFYTPSSSIEVSEGTLKTDQLANLSGVTATVSISDPAGGTALTVGTDNGSSTFAGTIQNASAGTGSLLKTGTGTFTPTGANTYSGGTTIDGGAISVSADSNLGATSGPLSFDGGKLLYSSLFSLNSSRAISLESGGGTIDTGSSNPSISQGITGSGHLTKTGSGKLTLTGSSSYSGGTTISAGTLLANNATGSATGSGAVNITSGAILGGIGSVAGGVTMHSNGTVAPGASAGTLTASSSLTLTGTYQCEIDGANADQLVVGGNLNISSGTLDIDLLSGGATESVYVIATYDSLTGSSFATVTDLPAGYEISYAYNGNQIALLLTSSYEYWNDSYDLSGTNALFDADPDGDGGKNGYEWATGTIPTNPASITMLGIGSTNTDAVVSFTRNTNATDVAIELQRSLNLVSNVWNGIATNTAGSWNPPGIVTETGPGNPVDVEITNSHTNHPAANYRLRVE